MTATTENWDSLRSVTLSRLVASFVVVAGFVQTRYWLGFSLPLLALSGLVIVLCLNDSEVPALGLRLSPLQGWMYWCWFTLWFGLIIGFAGAICTAVWLFCGWPLPIQRTPPSLMAFIHMCIDSPVSEEIIFRSLLTLAVLSALGERGTILFGGVIFALLHVVHGNPGPDNQLAGFMLGWAFLKSKTILVPLAMHALGNLIALGIQIAAWYLY